MAKLLVFELNPELSASGTFDDGLAQLQGKGVTVERYSLSQDITVFAAHTAVRRTMEQEGKECLPILLLDGRIVSQGAYPEAEEMVKLMDITFEGAPSILTGAVEELLALAVSAACNCERSFKTHFDQAVEMGIAKEDMIHAVNIALSIKNTPDKFMLQLAKTSLVGNSGCGCSCGDGGCGEGEGDCGCSDNGCSCS